MLSRPRFARCNCFDAKMPRHGLPSALLHNIFTRGGAPLHPLMMAVRYALQIPSAGVPGWRIGVQSRRGEACRNEIIPFITPTRHDTAVQVRRYSGLVLRLECSRRKTGHVWLRRTAATSRAPLCQTDSSIRNVEVCAAENMGVLVIADSSRIILSCYVM